MGVVDALIERLVKSGDRSICDRFSSDQLRRATLSYAQIVGHQDDIPDDGMAFVVGHALGYEDALKRAAVAMTDPRARGVESQVVGHLADGLGIEDALRNASARPASEDANNPSCGGNVIAFPAHLIRK